MYYANINFDKIPEIGFAFQHFCGSYKAKYGSNKMNIEIAFITSGTLEIELYGKKMSASSGSVVVLFRHLPVSIRTVGKTPYSHCSVLASFEDYDCKLFENVDNTFTNGFTVPFVTPHSEKAEQIGKALNRIACDMTNNRKNNALSSSVTFLSILGKISDIYHSQNSNKSKAYRNIVSSVYEYVEENINERISIEMLSDCINKSPNHISHAFKSCTGINITEYVNSQKAKKISSLLADSGLSFKESCAMVGFTDDTYGYKIFKKYMGVTPKEFILTQKIKKNI